MKKRTSTISLEHEILKTLYTQASFTTIGTGSQAKGTTPLYKRSYDFSKMHFGTLADALYNPDKYLMEKRPKGDLHYIQNKVVKKEETDLTEFQWVEVANALEILVLNGHVKDEGPENALDDLSERKITLLHKGAIDYRNNFYIKELEKEVSIKRAYEIQKKEHWQRKYWILVEIAKYIIGGIIGSAITLMVANMKIKNSQEPNTVNKR